ncbi:hexosaminidase [Luteibacter sp. UNCMF331Sha3.1]|uniref:family 20 glycosylhydrolase n=1 Tax=Luteibacter sp. UNCMF331Sha3.1 TaxID=1502760 RepID=UPI0008CDA9B9|nr:family 20 glycosylhydrolase [Luteibacter sp. UNCMF331Sha3.1]SEM58038.1 hexosaminidase [Luteibacter sp. UNCMF331Sha3.1]
MRRLLLLAMATGLTACATQPKQETAPVDAAPLSLIPMPAQVQRAPGHYRLDAMTTINVAPGDTQAKHVAAQLQGWIRQARGITPAIVEGKGKSGISLATVSSIKGREAYTLDVGANGVRIAANAETGLFYGAVTYWQLLTDPAAQNGVPAVHIVDAPRFEWRGLMLDSSRHFQSVSDIEHLLDQMAMHKLNTFHWHLTDDQGWRLQIEKYPKLTETGACRKAVGPDIALTGGADTPYCGFYTKDEAKQIVAYAAERHITVVPEIEMPGHAQAAVASYPKFGAGSKKLAVSSDWGVNTALYNVDDGTFTFLQDVLDEVMDIFPSTYIHVGGDEAAKDEWERSKTVQAKMKSLGITDEEKMQGWFIARIGTYLDKHGRRLIGWDEILDGDVPASATVMSWRGTEGAIKAANAGHDVVMAPSPTLYLDRLQSTLPDEPPGRPSGQSLRTIYDFDPVPKEIAGANAHHVLGAQVTVFSEYIPTWSRTQHVIFPRIAALAERTWSPKADWNDFVARLPAQMSRYRAAGIVPADGAFAVAIATEEAPGHKAKVTLSNQTGYGTVRYTTDGSAPTAQSTAYTGPFDVDLPSTVRANAFEGGFGLAGPRDREIDAKSLLRRTSDELDMCGDKLVLRLESPNAVDGVRPVYKVDIMDTCWIWKGAKLDGRYGLSVTVDRLPYNYALWKDVKGIVSRKSRSAAGELEVHQDTCDGPKLATIPLAKAKDGRATLDGILPKREGTHDLCFVITGKPGPKMWVLGDVQLR